MTAIEFRDLTSIDDFARVVGLEKRVWGYTDGDDVVPVPLLAATVHRGAVLLGAFDGSEMVGFAYSIPAIHRGRLSHWSHMLGVVPAFRRSGLGRQLKLVQRERVLALGLDLIEWTCDPLLALNAHLNFVKLGVVAAEYAEDLYGSSSSPLHGTLPTDRFIVQWWVRTLRVEERIRGDIGPAPAERGRGAVPVNAVQQVGRWGACRGADLAIDTDRLLVRLPPAFLDMLQGAPDIAREWREQTRAIFTTYFGRGYVATDFLYDRATGRGSYLLEARGAEPRF